MTETQLQTKIWEKEGWTVWSISDSLNRQNFLDADEKAGKYLKNSEKFAVEGEIFIRLSPYQNISFKPFGHRKKIFGVPLR